jgi:hypothetical protein
MIYDFPDPQAPIRQGDILRQIPRIEFDPARLLILADSIPSQAEEVDWLKIATTMERIPILVTFHPVCAIVITQDCDAVRSEEICLCEVDRFDLIYPTAKNPKNLKNTVSLITRHSRANLKWFYLPRDPRVGFTVPMAVDFQSVLRIPRTYLEQNIERLRLARLNGIADEHFRERLAEYFRRYPYDEWYPLDKAEFEEYRQGSPEPIQPYPWQE